MPFLNRILSKPSLTTQSLIFLLTFTAQFTFAQTVIGGDTPDASAILDLQSTNQGFLLPRLSTDQRNAIQDPATGLMIFNVSSNCLEINFGSPIIPNWEKIKCSRPSVDTIARCRAKISDSTYLNFMCHNLGAFDTQADPFIPAWEIIGNYWRWGELSPSIRGPINADLSVELLEQIPEFYQISSEHFWSDAVKKPNDPCPVGFRLPTSYEWKKVLENNDVSFVGDSWSGNNPDFRNGLMIGDDLFLPAGGSPNLFEPIGKSGFYHTSTDSCFINLMMVFDKSIMPEYGVFPTVFNTTGSVRCVEMGNYPNPGSIQLNNCDEVNLEYDLISGVYTCNIANIGYADGNGLRHWGQTVASAGVSGLTAHIPAGEFETGDGTLNVIVSGTPDSEGTCVFLLNIGGSSCLLVFPVINEN
jgi:hypothetical protein